MTSTTPLKTLKNPKATKEQLREALAAALGVVYEPPQKDKQITVFTQCRNIFLEAYYQHTGLHYSFMPIDGRSLAQLIDKVGGIVEVATDEAVIATFRLLILKLPDWYKQHQFSIKVINNKFNEIVASIKQNGGKQQTGDSLECKLAQRANARRSDT